MSDFIYDKQFKVWHRSNLENFDYSDGEEVEKYLYDVVSSSKDKSSHSQELNGHIKDWPTEYHLSSVRQNLLRSFDFSKCNRILDLGCGCGAILRFFGESGAKEVIGVDGSFARAKVASARCEDLSNVNVYVSNLMDFKSEEKFDVISLIGVLEYSPMFIDSEDPVNTCLKHCIDMLSDNGTLIIAIENQLGLKYFAGYPEDHVGKKFFGIQGLYADKTPITFGKKELIDRIKKTGYEDVKFYYPFPDYKLPNVVLSEEGARNESFNVADLLLKSKSKFYNQDSFLYFDESLVQRSICKNNLTENFANSFLLFVSKNKKQQIISNWLAQYFISPDSISNKEKIVFTVENGEKIVANSYYLRNTGESRVKLEEYVIGELLVERLKKAIIQDFLGSKTISLVNKWIEFLKKNEISNNVLSSEFTDCIPANLIILENGNLEFIDRTPIFDQNVSIKFIVFRGLIYTIHSITYPISLIGKTFKEIISNIFKSSVLMEISDEEMANMLKLESEIQNKNTSKKLQINYEEQYRLFATNKISNQVIDMNFEIAQKEEELKLTQSEKFKKEEELKLIQSERFKQEEELKLSIKENEEINNKLKKQMEENAHLQQKIDKIIHPFKNKKFWFNFFIYKLKSLVKK